MSIFVPPPTSPGPDDVSVPAQLPPPPMIYEPPSPSIYQPPSPSIYQPPSPSIYEPHTLSQEDILRPSDPFIFSVPPVCVFEPPRGRPRSRSSSPSLRSPSPSYLPYIPYDPSYDYLRGGPLPYTVLSSPSRSRSSESCRCPTRHRQYRPRTRTPSPVRRYSYYHHTPQPAPPPPPPPLVMVSCPGPDPHMVYPPTQTPLRSRSPTVIEVFGPTPPPVTPAPLPPVQPLPPLPPLPGPLYDPVDVLTFHYNENMAYAPAAKTYDEAIDTLRELWPELCEFDRSQISLHVGGSDQLVRVPKIAWQIILGDIPRYEVMHVHVDQLPPPPQYQGDEKGKMNEKAGSEADKAPPSRGFFSRIFRSKA